MISPKIEIRGLRQLENNLLALGAEIGSKVLTSALREAAKPMLQEIQLKAAVGSYGQRIVKKKGGGDVVITPGFMRSRAKIRASRNKKGAASKKFSKNTSAIVRVGVFRVPYARYVEFGTSDTKAQPFIRPAADKADESVRIFKRRLERKIYLAARKLGRKKSRLR